MIWIFTVTSDIFRQRPRVKIFETTEKVNESSVPDNEFMSCKNSREKQKLTLANVLQYRCS